MILTVVFNIRCLVSFRHIQASEDQLAAGGIRSEDHHRQDVLPPPEDRNLRDAQQRVVPVHRHRSHPALKHPVQVVYPEEPHARVKNPIKKRYLMIAMLDFCSLHCSRNGSEAFL